MNFFRRGGQEPPAMTLEGMLGPNSRLDEAAGLRVEAPDALCVMPDGRLLMSSGRRVLALGKWGTTAEIWSEFDRPVTALACSAGGLVAIGLAAGGFTVRDGFGRPFEGWARPVADVESVVDCAFLSEDEIVIVDSGYGSDADVLSVAPWDDLGRGKLTVLRRTGESQIVARGLHCPMGVCRDQAGNLLVSLLERAMIVDAAGAVRRSGFPAYLGRIRPVATGYAIACLSRRDPLIEFLKGEKEFIVEMKASIEPRHWISPRATPQFSHDFPIELGATRLFGEVKPWAPSFSYGLVIETDDQLMPVGSSHSRANGRRHAISDVALWNGELTVVSKASGEVLNLGSGGGEP